MVGMWSCRRASTVAGPGPRSRHVVGGGQIAEVCTAFLVASFVWPTARCALFRRCPDGGRTRLTTLASVAMHPGRDRGLQSRGLQRPLHCHKAFLRSATSRRGTPTERSEGRGGCERQRVPVGAGASAPVATQTAGPKASLRAARTARSGQASRLCRAHGGRRERSDRRPECVTPPYALSAFFPRQARR